MKSIKRLCICGCMMFILTNSLYAQDWRGITPLHSTRADVERLIGPPIKSGGVEYDLPNERVLIWYSEGRCVKGWPYGWNVPSGTVISITVAPKKELGLDDLSLDLSKYKKEVNEHSPNYIYYINEEQGISVEYWKIERIVTNINYSPAAKDSYLRCPNSKGKDTTEEAKRFQIDSYFDSTFNEEKDHLDYFATQLLQSEAGVKGYIVVYAGRRAYVREAQARLERAKNYLVKEKGIDAERIVIIDGGHRDRLRVELYIVPPNGAIPVASPTVHPSEVQIIKGNNVRKNNRRSTQSRCQ